MANLRKSVGIVLLFVGLFVFLSPDLYTWYFSTSNQQIIEAFQEEYSLPDLVIDEQTEAIDNTPSHTVSNAKQELFQRIQAYNERLYRDHQSGIADESSLTENPLSDCLSDALFGYITIPTMSVELPLYLGATDTNMGKGAVVLGQTSLPIGGADTNCVIAGHRGYRGAAYFREIERLQAGDSVFVTNPWETLCYTVTGMAIIQPDDLDSILIQQGKDMLTLVTCHPYRSHGKYRYIVYCERTGTLDSIPHSAENGGTNSHGNTTFSFGTVQEFLSGQELFDSSTADIEQEKILRLSGAGLILTVLMISLFRACFRCKDSNIQKALLFAVISILLVCACIVGFSAWSVHQSIEESAQQMQEMITAFS